MSIDAITLEKKKTATNYESEIMEARVIANYGDPGLDEDYHFDILSRYVVVMLESCQRTLTADKYPHMLAIVKRPESLWINTVGNPSTPASQQRIDASQNISAGLAGALSVNGISRIAPAYTFGEIIKIRKMTQPISPPDSFFSSTFTSWDTSTSFYNAWHSEGSSLPYFSSDSMRGALRSKTIEPVTVGSNLYRGCLNKYQYEAFALNLFLSNTTVSNVITTLFNNTWQGNPAVYSANGGYVFSNRSSISLNSVGFEDINVGGKARVADNSECVPLVVATPSSFPIPSHRAIGTIQYNPTYSPITQ